MASNASNKIVKFICGNVVERVKFSSAEPISSIDSTIRERCRIGADAKYHLIDMSDGTTISLFMLYHVDNESIIQVDVGNSNSVEHPPVSQTSVIAFS